MIAAAFVIGLVVVVVSGAGLARKIGTSAPLLLTVVGIAIGFLPGFPLIEVDREVVMLGLLPPLLYAAAIRTSLIDLKANLRSIALLSVGLVVFTAVGVGLLAWWLLGIPLPLALALGGIVAPPDAVAATAVARRINLPRDIVMILEGESLFNDATALVIVRMGLVALGTSVTAWQVGGQFLWAAAGGVAIGIAAAWIVGQVRGGIRETVSDTALSFITPWIAYLPAEAVGASGVLAVVTAGVLLGHKAALFQSAQSRMAERINWWTIQFLLENGVFLLIGLQAHAIIAGALSAGIGHVLLVSLAVLGAVIVLRPLWNLLTIPLWRETSTLAGAARAAVVAGWAGMRGVVTLAAALAIPADAPQRDVLIFIAFAVVAGTLVLQGYSLPWVARLMRVNGDDPREVVLQTATVIERTVAAGEAKLDTLDTAGVPPEVIGALRSMGDRRRHAAWERLSTDPSVESPGDAYRRLRLEMLGAERQKLLAIRDKGLVASEVLDEVMTSTDLEESMVMTFVHRTERARDAILRLPEANRGQCEHLQQAPECVVPLTPEGCAECLAAGDVWVSLRVCLSCGHVGCCDSSPGRHANGHYETSGHPVMRSFEPGEAWRWCYVDRLPG